MSRLKEAQARLDLAFGRLEAALTKRYPGCPPHRISSMHARCECATSHLSACFEADV